MVAAKVEARVVTAMVAAMEVYLGVAYTEGVLTGVASEVETVVVKEAVAAGWEVGRAAELEAKEVTLGLEVASMGAVEAEMAELAAKEEVREMEGETQLVLEAGDKAEGAVVKVDVEDNMDEEERQEGGTEAWQNNPTVTRVALRLSCILESPEVLVRAC